MRHLVLWVLAGTVLLCASISAATAPKPTHAFQVPEGKRLALTIPEEYPVEHVDTIFGTVEIEIGKEGGDWVLLITVQPPAETPPDPESERERIEAVLLGFGRQQLEDSVEDRVEIQDLHHPGGAGLYYSITEASEDLPEDEYWYMLQGIVLVGEVLVPFTFLSNDPGDELRESVLGIVRSAAYGQAPQDLLVEPAARVVIPQEFVLRLPDRDWVLVLDTPGFTLEELSSPPGGTQAGFHAEHRKTGIVVSAFLEQEKRPLTAVECRDMYFSRITASRLKRKWVRTWEAGNAAYGESFVERHKRRRVDWKSVHAYLAAPGDVCIDVHVSKEQYTEADEKRFTDIFDSIRIGPAAGVNYVR